MPERVELNPPWPWASQFRIAQGVRVGNTVYVSGQVAFDPQGNLVGGDDMGAQSRQVFVNIQAVLAEAGRNHGGRGEDHRVSYRYEPLRGIRSGTYRGVPEQYTGQCHSRHTDVSQR